MDYRAIFKEKLSKMLFLEIDQKGFKNTINMPDYVELDNETLFIPISSEYITSNIKDEVKIKNLPIYYFVEGILMTLAIDKDFRLNNDYECIMSYIKDGENYAKGLIANKVKNEDLIDAYLLLKGLYRFAGEIEVLEKLLVVGESLREKDSAFSDILMEDIEYTEEQGIKSPIAYLYKAIILNDKGDYRSARVAINEYKNRGGKETDDVKIVMTNITNLSDYETAIEMLETEPAKAIGLLLGLADQFSGNPLLYYYISVAYRNLENYEKAIYYLNESLEIETGILEVIVELGINYACLGEYEEAIKYFKKAFEASKNVEICTNIVMCYMNLNNDKDAKLHIEIAKKLKADDEIVMQLDKMLNS